MINEDDMPFTTLAISGTGRQTPSPAMLEARKAAYRLGGNEGAAALFSYGEIGPCPACDPTTVIVRVSMRVFRDAGGTEVAKSPGKVEHVHCELCGNTFLVKAYLSQADLTAPLILSSYHVDPEPT
jgi:hypothetical protein